MNAGEVHAIMGPNGSGKSTLAQVIAGHPGYDVTAGSVTYDGKDLLAMQAEERAQAGVFLAFQYPVEIPGVTNAYFFRAAYNEVRKANGKEELDPIEFLDLMEKKLKLVEMDQAMLHRSVNAGFSGGEKKRNEILQMAVLEPKLAILDETDSGLDIDALRVVAGGVNALRAAGQRDDRRHALPAPAQLHRARFRARARPRPDREVRRQGARARARGARIRLGDGGRLTMAPARTSTSEGYEQAFVALRATGAPCLASGAPPRSHGPASARSDSRRRATRTGTSRA